LLGLLTCLPACGPSESERAGVSQSGTGAAEWEWLQSTKQQLDHERERLARLEAQAGAAAETARLRKEVDDLAAELNRRLVEHINANAGAFGGGKPPDERQLAAIRMKSDEDVLLARQYIEQAGDYRRAIEIYETALAADPDNPRLQSALEAARARRYVTRERFAQLREGMTQDEVRRLLGPPNLQDVRDYPERGVTAWFYPKDASGAAAAVWFRKDAPKPEAYLLDFNALQPPSPSSGTVPRRTVPRAQPSPSPPAPPVSATPSPSPSP
jgi:hypothetical protein